jgi:hypothetical protein
MQAVSDAWKADQEEKITVMGLVDIRLRIADPDALEDMSIETNGVVYLANPAQIIDDEAENFLNYATLELNQWTLNGRKDISPQPDLIIPEDAYGYVGNVLSDQATLEFPTQTPTITILFSVVHNRVAPGITIQWSTAFNEYAVSFTVNVYDGNNAIIATQTVTDNDRLTSILSMEYSGYQKIELLINEWCLPGHYPRVEDFFPGIDIKFEKTQLTSYAHEIAADPLGLAPPKSVVSFAVDNTSDIFDPNNETGMTPYLIVRQTIIVRYGFEYSDGFREWIPAGTFYLESWDAPQGGLTADFSAGDILRFANKTYNKGVYASAGRSLYALAMDVINETIPASATTVTGAPLYSLDPSLQSIMTTAPLPQATSAECLQLIANAAGCGIWVDRQGVIHIAPIDITADPADYMIGLFNSYSYTDIEVEDPIATLEVIGHTYSLGDAGKELGQRTVSGSGQRTVDIAYSNMATAVSVTVTGGTLVSATYGSYQCSVTATGTGGLTMIATGTLLNDSSSPMASTAIEEEGIEQKVDNPLITSDAMAANVLVANAAYLSKRNKGVSTWRADPRLDVLDIITNENKYSTKNELITAIKYEFKGAFHGSAEGRIMD